MNHFLRTLEIRNAQELFALTEKNRHYLREWLPWLDNTRTVKDSEKFIVFTQEQAIKKEGITFGIMNNCELVGVCSLQNICKANRSANIGYWISKDKSGQGTARKAAQRLIEFAFTELKIHRIEIHCASKNFGSQKVAEACGLTFEGVSKDCEWLYNHFVDHKIYAILNCKQNTTTSGHSQ